MGTSIFFIASVLFVVLTFTLAGLLLYGLQYALEKVAWKSSDKKKVLLFTMIGLATWFTFTGILAANGFFTQFDAIPPRFIILILPPLVLLAILGFSAKFSQLLTFVLPAWLIHIQAFRIVMEIILWLTFLDAIIPVQMTFEGKNFDILVGLTAPIIAYFCFQRKSWPTTIAFIWNLAGLGLLINIVVISILSAPTPFRVFMNEPANTFVAYLPFVWLPAFVVPIAMWMHVFSLKQLLRAKSKSHNYTSSIEMKKA